MKGKILLLLGLFNFNFYWQSLGFSEVLSITEQQNPVRLSSIESGNLNQNSNDPLPIKTRTPEFNYLADLSITGQWFLSFQEGKTASEDFNYFNLKRGYINITKKLTNKISGRITPDISVDREGDGEGDVELRLKYCYLKYELPSLSFLTNPYLEFGLVHRPWLDFEEHINDFRVQGTMFLERNGILDSGDYGLSLVSLLGGEINKAYQNKVNHSYPGKYGSLAIGIYNGGGYHAIEKNQNKSIEGRLTLRPFPQFLPGLQFSYHGVYGKGNVAFEPEWSLNMLFGSFEHSNLILTALYYTGKGNFKGTVINDADQALANNGFSFFSEIKLFHSRWSIIGRFDTYHQQFAVNEYWTSLRYIGGLAYYFHQHCKILIDYDRGKYKDIDRAKKSVFEIAVEVHY